MATASAIWSPRGASVGRGCGRNWRTNMTRRIRLPNHCAPAACRREAIYATRARIEAGLRRFLEQGILNAFTDTFEDLHGLRQLPGVAVQRLMADGYGFGGEGDWKTAALVRP